MKSSKAGTLSSYAGQLGLRFKALRVHRECRSIYTTLGSASAARFIPSIRVDHYYPWLFLDDLPIKSNRELRELAVANVLLSDFVLGTLRALRATGPVEEENKVEIYRSVMKLGNHRLDCLLGNDPVFQNGRQRILEEQISALIVEQELIGHNCVITDVEAEKHATQKSAYLKVTLLALGQLSGDAERAELLIRAQAQFSIAFDLYNSLISWRTDLPIYPANRVLAMAHSEGYSINDVNQCAEAIYQSHLMDRVFELIFNACRAAQAYDYASHHFRLIIQWLIERTEKLHSDLLAIRKRGE
ncbi:MAG: hypothetical protein ACRD4L_05675 [Pyrinomonadaceae bacterium]